LHGYEDQLSCTPAYNDQNDLRCDWPSTLDFAITNSQGRFSQNWLVQQEGWVQLPGNSRNWPRDVTVNGNPAIVLNMNGQPKIRLARGQHTVTGSFSWKTIPEFIAVPVYTGLVSLILNGKSVDFPNLDANGRL